MKIRYSGADMRRQICSSLFSGVCTLTIAGPAAAQAAADGSAGLEEVVVTAQRRAESLQNVPIQVAAFNAAKIEDAGIKSARDFAALIPNVTIDDSFTYLNSYVAVRGVSQINNADSPVAVLVDGVPQNNQKQLRMTLFDIERIEVLKGPQGGLYGRNAIGGAINIITKAPSDHLEGFVQSSYGRGEALDVASGISTPLSDSAGLRIAGSYKTDDGRIRNVFRGDNVDFINHDWELRGRFTADVSDTIKTDLRASYRDFDGYGPFNSDVVSGRADDYQPPRSNLEGISFGFITDAAAKIDFDLGRVTLTSITSYTDLKENYRGDLDISNAIDRPGGFRGFGFQGGQAQDLRTELASQEFRLVSDSEERFRWIFGAYYLHTKRDFTTAAFRDVDGTYNHLNDPAFQFFRAEESNKNEAYASYLNLDYDLTDRLTLSSAFRYDRDERRQTNLVTGAVRETDFSAPQPKATITYKFTPQRLAYATYSKGFRSGGFNSPIAPIPIFEAETLQNYEAGFKTSWLGNKLIVNGAVYRADDENAQYFFVAPLAGQIVANIDKVRIWGVELDVQALVAPGLQVFGSLGTTDSEIQRNSVDPSVVGNKMPRTVPWSANLGFQFNTPVTDRIGLMARVDYQHRSKKYWEATNDFYQDPVDMLDVRLGFEGGNWSIVGFGRNVLDEVQFVEFFPPSTTGSTQTIAALGQPATYGIELRYEF